MCFRIIRFHIKRGKIKLSHLITVIVPVYNTSKQLKRCLDSLKSQTYKNLEIIIIDDGSTDDSCSIYKKYIDNKIFFSKRTQNMGLSHARNLGLQLSHGDYICFVDSDDYIESDFISTLYSNIISYNCDISIVSYNIIENDNKKAYDSSGELVIYDSIDALKELLIDKKIQNYVWNKMFSKKTLSAFPIGRFFEDLGVMYKYFSQSSRIVYQALPKYNYVIHNTSIVNNSIHQKYVDEIELAVERYLYLKNNKNIQYFEKENSFGLVIWFLRVYIFMTTAGDNDSYFLLKYKHYFDQAFSTHESFIVSNLSNEKKIVAYSLLFDYNKCRRIIKILKDKSLYNE